MSKKNFLLRNLFDQKNFLTQNFFDQNFFMAQKFFYQIFFDQNLKKDIIFDKRFLTKIFGLHFQLQK